MGKVTDGTLAKLKVSKWLVNEYARFIAAQMEGEYDIVFKLSNVMSR
jgi:hypothetical protein